MLQNARSRIPESDGDGLIDDVVAAELDESMLALDRLVEANLPQTLLDSLFLGLFSAFDAFSGNLLTAIYKMRPELLDSLNVEIPLANILKHQTFDELKESVLYDEIERFRRKSYVEQFEQLECRFGLKLRAFGNWPRFVELGQRRNLVTHCEGIVSKQYLRICMENSVQFEDEIQEGTRLKVSQEYLLEACSVIYEVSLKLGQTLWRKLFPDEFLKANEHLEHPVYEALRIERWDRAIVLAEFAASVQNGASDLDRRVRIINHAIALRFSGKIDECEAMLNSEDWTAAARDFKLAVEVLFGRHYDAANLMRHIGSEGDLLKQKSYHVWPLFREFRKTQHFLDAYQDVYGTSFATGLAEEAKKVANQSKDTSNDEPEVESDVGAPDTTRPPLSMIKLLMG